MEGTMYQYKTEVQKQYKVYDMKPPEKAKMKDNLSIADDSADSEVQKRRDDYSGYNYDQAPNSKVSRPADNLHPEDGTMKQYKTEAQKKFAPVSGDYDKSKPYKPGSQIKNGGDINFGTENQANFQSYDTLSTKVPPPHDNLFPIEGTMSQYKTEAQKRFKAYDNVQPSEPIKRPDQFDFEHDNDEDSGSEQMKQVNGAVPERATKIRPSTTLARDGNIDWETNKKTDYLPYDYSKQAKSKAEDNLKPLEGKFKDKSESKKQYDGRQGERTNQARPNTSMLREGDFDWETNKKAEYKEHQLSKQEILKAQDNLKPLQGKLKNKSESKNQYDGRQGERSNKVRPSTAMLTEGDFDWETKTNSEYKEHKFSKQEPLKIHDNLKPFEGRLKDKSESKKQYDGRQGERTNKARPSTAMLTDGNFDWETSKKTDYKQHELIRQQKLKTQDNLMPLDGKLRDKSESKKQFDGRQADRTNLARPNTSMLREGNFDWETNKKSEFKQHDVKRQEHIKAQDNLKIFDGKLRDKTETKKQFTGQPTERSQMARPATTMLQGGDFDWNTRKTDDFRTYDGHQKPDKVKVGDNLGVPGKHAKLDGVSESKSTYQAHPSDLVSEGREPRQRGQKGNLALLDAPLEGMSESKSNYGSSTGHDVSRAHDRPKPKGHLEVNKGSPFSQKNSTSNQEYQAGLPFDKAQKVCAFKFSGLFSIIIDILTR